MKNIKTNVTLSNNAGVYLENAIEDVEEDEFDRIMSINLKGAYFLCKYAVPHLKTRRECFYCKYLLMQVLMEISFAVHTVLLKVV